MSDGFMGGVVLKRRLPAEGVAELSDCHWAHVCLMRLVKALISEWEWKYTWRWAKNAG